jgi:hypothetical protein
MQADGRSGVATTSPKKTVDDYVAGLEGWQADIVTSLREILREAAPDAREAFKWAQPVWEQNGPICYVKVFSRHINFGFWRGASLVAPDGLLQTGGTKMAHIRLSTASDVQRDLFRKLVVDAVNLNLTEGDPTKNRAN